MYAKAIIMGALTVAVIGASATAQSLRLSAAEAQSELFGVELEGVIEGDGTPWRECIAPDGSTLYEIEERRDAGLLTINESGEACFSYASSGYTRQSCWRVWRTGRDNYRFEIATSPAFVTRVVRRGVRACEGSGSGLIG